MMAWKYEETKNAAATLCARGLIDLLAGTAMLGCGDDSDDDRFDGWHGEEAHLIVSGVIDGEKVELNIVGE